MAGRRAGRTRHPETSGRAPGSTRLYSVPALRSKGSAWSPRSLPASNLWTSAPRGRLCFSYGPPAVVLLIIFPVRAAAHARHPPLVFAIPGDRLCDAALELHARPPSGLPHQLFARKRIAPVVPGPVRDVLDQALGLSGEREHLAHHLQIGQRAVAADVVDLAGAPAPQDFENAAAMVVHVEPVADLHAVAVNRQRPVLERVRDHQRDQLFRKLIRSIVIG